MPNVSEPQQQSWTKSDFEVTLSLAKRQRTLGLSQSQSTMSSVAKGKEKIEEIKDENEDAESELKVCGICFSEDGKAIRGWIDCCNHYFCFICIMEWSKVESRCPMCKQRFSTIRRPPKDGVFLNERIVNVPVRDQVWHPFGNATTGPPDPYAQVNCAVCHSSLDENLLLLCDLCDSAAHTYCVGFGFTVPEGDWYCHDCTVSRNDHTNCQNDADSSQCSRNLDTIQAAGASVSISEIIQESYFVEADQPSRNSQQPEQLFSPPGPDRDNSSRTKMMDPSVRTLRRCRNVQSRIQSLREHWNALQSGSLNFSSNLPCSGEKNKGKNRPLICKSGQPQSSSDVDCPQKINNVTLSSSKLNNKNSHDIDKAWKMMNMARSMQQASEGTMIGFKAGKRNMLNVSTNTSSSCSVSKGKLSKEKDSCNANSKNCRFHDLEISQNMHRFENSEKQKPNKGPAKEILKFNKKPASTDPPQCYGCPSPVQSQTLAQEDLYLKRRGNLALEVMNRAPSSSNGHQGSICLGSLSMSSPRDSDLSCRISEFGTSSGCGVKLPMAKCGMVKIPSEVGLRQNDGVKNEVQSLVKLNLKLLSRGKKLDVNEFKEIARRATHTILAACGLEHRKSSVFILHKTICKHSTDQNQLPHMWNLMPSSCRECFYVFVKDVVSSIMAERVA